MTQFSILDFIADRRDGKSHSEAALHEFSRLVATGQLPAYQVSAWLMAAYLNPLTLEETAWLTLGMADSGERLDLSTLPKPWVDKHSTGGVGDKTTIVLLPMLAACGVTVVKMSGRGLGITGGTLDKLASVPGFRLDLSPAEMVAQAGRIGLALTGQSPLLAPADKELYALRDATATVASIPLIVSSILSKKLAGGAETIVLDVKCGSGGFMPDLPHAQELATALEATGQRCGVRVKTEITDMSQPLGSAVGNAIEVQEALRVLRGEALNGPELRFRQLCVELAQNVLTEVGSQADPEVCLSSGAALAKATAWFEAQGAAVMDPVLEDLVETPVVAEASGWLARLDAGEVGRLVLDLGGGRHQKDDAVDLQVGVRILKSVGDPIAAGEPILAVRSRQPILSDTIRQFESAAVKVSPTPVEPPPLFWS